MDLNFYAGYIIHLLKCAILDKQPKPMPNGMEIEKLFQLSTKHNIDNIIYIALKKLNIQDDIMRQFEEYANHAILNDATQQYYLEMVIDEFEQKQIRHCVMKGPVIKPLYPSPDLRKSADLDIFIDTVNAQKAKDIMEGLGFKTERFNPSVADDAYSIDKSIEVELHRTLVSNKVPWQNECQKISERLVKASGYEYRYLMTIEDYYLYMIAHMAKHMKYSGMGIKMVLDIWIYLNRYNNELDWDKLNGYLNDCGLLEFSNNIKELVDYWFEGKETTQIIKRLGQYIVSSGVFGTYEQLVASDMGNNAGNTSNKTVSKLKLYLTVFFQPYSFMKERYKILNKLPFLLPFMWVYRAIYSIFVKKDNANAIKNKYDNVDMDYAKKLVEFKKEIGL